MMLPRLLRRLRDLPVVVLLICTTYACRGSGRVDDQGSPEDHFNGGVASLRAGEFQAASQELEQAIQVNPQMVEAYIYLGIPENQLGHFQDGLKTVQNGVKIDPRSGAAHYNLALSLIGLHRNDEAAKELRKALEIDPNNGNASYDLGLLMEQRGNLAKACEYLERAKAADREDLSTVVHLVDLYLRLKQKEKARSVIENEVRSDKNGAHAVGLSQALLSSGHAREAIATLNLARSLFPGEQNVAIALGHVYLEGGQFTQVIETLAPISDEAASWEVYYLRGVAFTSLGNKEDAAKSLLNALNMNPAQAPVHFAFGSLLLDSGDPRGRQVGVNEINQAIDLSPHEGKYYFALARYFFDKKNLPAAIGELKTAVVLAPPSIDLDATLALAELELEGPDAAKPFIDKAIDTDPHAGIGYDLLGRYYMRSGKDKDAAENYTKAAQLTPQNDIYSRDAAIALQKLSRSAEGVPYAERAVRLRPDQLYDHYILGKLYSDVGRRTEAIRELEMCVRLEPDNFLPYNLLAVLYRETGAQDKAKICWEKLKSLKEQSARDAQQKFAELRSLPH